MSKTAMRRAEEDRWIRRKLAIPKNWWRRGDRRLEKMAVTWHCTCPTCRWRNRLGKRLDTGDARNLAHEVLSTE